MAALPATEWARVRDNLKPIFMPRADVLYEPRTPVDHIYFPTTSIISLLHVLSDGRADAVALVGGEGFASVTVFLGGDSALCRAVVQSEGWGYQIQRGLLEQECERGGSMRAVLLRYAQSYIAQVAQTGVCNRHHSIDQQLCRWLLMFLDRQTSNELTLTHERIAEIMGVRRESVTVAATKLQVAGIIRYHHGRIAVVERTGLEDHSCECYAIARREADRLMEAQTAVGRARSELPERLFPAGEMPCSIPLQSY
ncbi:MAG: Crp/Fnr family transcriptional regulator [Steroidobacteraceae bacterium]